MENVKSVIANAILVILMMVFFLGIGAADSLMEQGRWWIGLLCIICPFVVGWILDRLGVFEWIK